MDYLKLAALIIAVPSIIAALFVLLKGSRRPRPEVLVRRALSYSLSGWLSLKPIEQQRLQAALYAALSGWAVLEIKSLALREMPDCEWIGFIGDEAARPEVVISGPRDDRPTGDEMQKLSEKLGKPVFYTTLREGKHV